jgi:type IV pilus assembly protein PilV
VIFSFGVLALAGLQAAMVKNTTNSKYRADASFIAQRQLGLIWSNPTQINTFLMTDAAITDLPNGLMTVERPVASSGNVHIVVKWTAPGETQHKYDINGNISTGCPTCP